MSTDKLDFRNTKSLCTATGRHRLSPKYRDTRDLLYFPMEDFQNSRQFVTSWPPYWKIHAQSYDRTMYQSTNYNVKLQTKRVFRVKLNMKLIIGDNIATLSKGTLVCSTLFTTLKNAHAHALGLRHTVLSLLLCHSQKINQTLNVNFMRLSNFYTLQ